MYRVLYRKWRPKVFSDVVGQPHVTRTLSAEVREDRLSHAWLFTGSRGTGKTTCAKILSKAINCLHPVNGDPCNECEICRGIDAGTVLDIVEIDAASNRGIDDIRLLRDETNFSPAQAKYRVYIIDEVHMLTIEAFNALLKTLEEPPAHVKFILATTEVHKLPSTILSRCQRFDFRRIEPKIIADRLLHVAAAEGATLHEDAAMLIARVADGGMRDALSLLDSAMSVSSDVTTAVVSDCAGLMGRDKIYDLIRAVAAGDAARCLRLLDDLHNASCDTERLLGELTNQFRNFLILKTVSHPENLIVSTADELELLKEIAGLFTNEFVLFALGVLTKTAEAVKRTQNRRIEAEMALLRLCAPETDTDVAALSARIAKLEETVALLQKNGVPAAPAPPAVPQTDAPVPAVVPAPQPAPAVRNEAPAPAPAPAPEEEDEPTPFEGFGQERGGVNYAAQFASDEEDDEPFDFDRFMQEHTGEAAAQPDPQPAAQPAPAPAPQKPAPAPQQQAAAPQPEGAVDKVKWTNLVMEAEHRQKPLTGKITGSRARIVGDTIIIKIADPRIRVFFNEKSAAELLQPFLLKHLGRTYDVRFEY